jgi:DNA-binding protein H-NS
MAASYKELQAQIAQLTSQAEEQRKSELGSAIEQIRTIVREFGLTESDLSKLFKGGRTARPVGKVPPKYADPATGATWSGRGLPPKWIAVAHKAGTHDKFLIDHAGKPAEQPAKKRRATPAKPSKRGG